MKGPLPVRALAPIARSLRRIDEAYFHWRPRLGMQSTIWDEALKLQAADEDPEDDRDD